MTNMFFRFGKSLFYNFLHSHEWQHGQEGISHIGQLLPRDPFMMA